MESLSSVKLAENQKSLKVSEIAAIDLEFEKKPDSYEVHVWNAGRVGRGPYMEVVLHESSGRTVYQVIGRWEQGMGSYVFSLRVE